MNRIESMSVRYQGSGYSGFPQNGMPPRKTAEDTPPTYHANFPLRRILRPHVVLRDHHDVSRVHFSTGGTSANRVKSGACW